MYINHHILRDTYHATNNAGFESYILTNNSKYQQQRISLTLAGDTYNATNKAVINMTLTFVTHILCHIIIHICHIIIHICHNMTLTFYGALRRTAGRSLRLEVLQPLSLYSIHEHATCVCIHV